MGGGGVWSFYVLAGGWFAGWAIRVMLNCCWVVHMIRFLGWVAGGWLLAGSRPCIGTVPYVSQYPSARIGIPRIGWCGVGWCLVPGTWFCTGLVSVFEDKRHAPVQISTLRKKVAPCTSPISTNIGWESLIF
jgi:hypothetical protein